MSSRLVSLGLDVGTQSTKALLVSCADGSVVARGSAAHAPLPPSSIGRAEQDPREWWRAVQASVRMALDAAGAVEVVAVGVSGQQHGCVLVDAGNQPVGPAKLWCDTETATQAQEFEQRTGRALPVGWTLSKVLYTMQQRPEQWSRADGVLLPHEWINAQLTGRRAAEAGDASGTGWWDARTRQYDSDILTAVGGGLAQRLPALVASHALVGTLLPEPARYLGLPAGLPVSAGGGDNMLSAIGAGAVSPGPFVISLGTSATVFTHSTQPVLDPRALVSPFCDSTGGWLPLMCLLNCTGVLEELRLGYGLSHASLAQLALASPAGGDGLLFVPWLLGERVPAVPRAAGTMLGLRSGMLQPGPLARAAVEGVAHGLLLCLQRLRLFGMQPDGVRLVGGAARSPLWTRVLADTLGLPVTPLLEVETAALGAALQAQWACQPASSLQALVQRSVRLDATVHPEAAGVEALQQAHKRYLEWLEQAHGAAARVDRL